MGVDKLRPHNDPRFTHEYATLNGRRYHYLLALPPGGKFTRTVFLIHGWPDLSFGWRYQVPLFLGMGCRVVCPDNMGFGRTEAPHVPPEAQNLYGLKRCADDIAELAKQLGAGQIILGGHDWGGAVVYRVCLWHPSLVSHLFVVCTPYLAPRPSSVAYTPLRQLVETKLPFWAYQLHLGSGEVQQRITSRAHLTDFISGIFGGKGAKGELIFDAYKGVLFDNLGKIGPSPLMDAAETEYYVDEYYRNGLDGTLNWYKTHQTNHEDELALKAAAGEEATLGRIDIPVLFIQASGDVALPPALSEGMEDFIPKLQRKEVRGTHWVLWQQPEHCNELIRAWLSENSALPASSHL